MTRGKKSKTQKPDGPLQLPLWAPISDWCPPDLNSLPSWENAQRIAIDVETRDDNLRTLGIGVRRGGYMTGVSFAIEDGLKYYLPFAHEGGDNLPKEKVIGYLKENAKKFTGIIVGANLSYDLDYLWEEGIHFPQVKFFRDIQIADPLIYELQDSYSLESICQRHGIPGKSEQLLQEAAQAYNVDPKGGMWRLPARFVGLYGEDDSDRPLKVLRKQEKLIDDRNLWQIYDLESKVLPILIKYRRRGVKIDQDKLEQIETWTLQKEQKACDLIKDQTGINLGRSDLSKAKALAPVLEHIGIRLYKTPSGMPNIDKDVLSNIDHSVAEAMLHARKVNKLRTTFASSIRRYMVNGRIHCTFNQIAREDEAGAQRGVRYGRLSATHPNLQQQPSRDEFAAMWRSIYVAEDDGIWGCLDFSQQEPRWTTHFAAVMDLPKAREAAQAYWDNPKLDNHNFMTKLVFHLNEEDNKSLFEKRRKQAKGIYLGLCYGEGGAKMCDDLGLPTRYALRIGRGRILYFETSQEALDARKEYGDGFMWRAAGEEGQKILDQFDDRAPFIRKLASTASGRASQNGFVTTVCGRHLHFPMRQDSSYDWTHKALNRIIQGCSADQMKTAMVLIDEQMPDSFIQLQVHDELDGSFSSVQEAKQVAELMETCIPNTKVPFRVDVECGSNWGEIKEII